MSGAPAPSAEAQLAFLAKLQRLFAEGDFTATYKFALLVSLAELAVDWGRDDGDELVLSNRQIGERFIALYWRHVTPYAAASRGQETAVLVQNVGAQASVLTTIEAFREGGGATTLAQAKQQTSYSDLVSRVASVVSAQPLNYLQNFGGGTDKFLYERFGRGNIRLHPGVAYCLRRFHPLVQQLSRNHWMAHIKRNRRNRAVIGDGDDLDEFLFGSSRQSLALIGAGLLKLDGPTCFYCGERMGQFDVDHFVPFSLYGRDLSHNFVLAHPNCNRSKSDTLAGRRHLEGWLNRLVRRGDELAEIGQAAGLGGDASASRRVASWAYGNALASGGNAWLRPSSYEPVDAAYIGVLA